MASITDLLQVSLPQAQLSLQGLLVSAQSGGVPLLLRNKKVIVDDVIYKKNTTICLIYPQNDK